MAQENVSELERAAKIRMARPRTATDYISQSLRRSILSGDLEGGTRLSLTELATTFEVSTTPVREALRELSFEGLVQLDTYKGGKVKAVSRDDVEEIVRIRQVLEPLAIEEAVDGMTEEILADAIGILEEMEASDEWEVWVHGNRAFHTKLYEAASSRRLASLISSLQDTTVVFVSAVVPKNEELRTRAAQDHWAMIEAARAGDAQRLTELTLAHLAIPLGNEP